MSMKHFRDIVKKQKNCIILGCVLMGLTGCVEDPKADPQFMRALSTQVGFKPVAMSAVSPEHFTAGTLSIYATTPSKSLKSHFHRHYKTKHAAASSQHTHLPQEKK